MFILKTEAGTGQINIDGTIYKPDEQGLIAVGTKEHCDRLAAPPFNFLVINDGDPVPVDIGQPQAFKLEIDWDAFPTIRDLMDEHQVAQPVDYGSVLGILEEILALAGASEGAPEVKPPTRLEAVRAELEAMGIVYPASATLKVLEGMLKAEKEAQAASKG